MPPSIVMLSGGLDSTVNLGLALAEGAVVAAVTCDYGQRAAARERAAAQALCEHYDVRHHRVDLSWLGEIADTPLTRRTAGLPDPRVEGEDAADAAVWIPNRNGVLMNVGAAYAEALGADLVVTGFNAEEAANFPDNTGEFLDALTRSFVHSTRPRVAAVSYTVDMDKAAIMRLAKEHDMPRELSWCCYDDGAERCWACSSCVRFADAAERSGGADGLRARGVSLPAR